MTLFSPSLLLRRNNTPTSNTFLPKIRSFCFIVTFLRAPKMCSSNTHTHLSINSAQNSSSSTVNSQSHIQFQEETSDLPLSSTPSLKPLVIAPPKLRPSARLDPANIPHLQIPLSLYSAKDRVDTMRTKK